MGVVNELNYIDDHDDISTMTMVWDIHKILIINKLIRLFNSFSCYFVPPNYDFEGFKERVNLDSKKIEFENNSLERLKRYLIEINKLRDYRHILLTQNLLNQIELMINNRIQRLSYFVLNFYDEGDPNGFPIFDESQMGSKIIMNGLEVLEQHIKIRKPL